MRSMRVLTESVGAKPPPKSTVTRLMRAGKLNEPGRGIALVLSVDEVEGIVHREEPSEE